MKLQKTIVVLVALFCSVQATIPSPRLYPPGVLPLANAPESVTKYCSKLVDQAKVMPDSLMGVANPETVSPFANITDKPVYIKQGSTVKCWPYWGEGDFFVVSGTFKNIDPIKSIFDNLPYKALQIGSDYVGGIQCSDWTGKGQYGYVYPENNLGNSCMLFLYVQDIDTNYKINEQDDSILLEFFYGQLFSNLGVLQTHSVESGKAAILSDRLYGSQVVPATVPTTYAVDDTSFSVKAGNLFSFSASEMEMLPSSSGILRTPSPLPAILPGNPTNAGTASKIVNYFGANSMYALKGEFSTGTSQFGRMLAGMSFSPSFWAYFYSFTWFNGAVTTLFPSSSKPLCKLASASTK